MAQPRVDGRAMRRARSCFPGGDASLRVRERGDRQAAAAAAAGIFRDVEVESFADLGHRAKDVPRRLARSEIPVNVPTVLAYADAVDFEPKRLDGGFARAPGQQGRLDAFQLCFHVDAAAQFPRRERVDVDVVVRRVRFAGSLASCASL